MTALDTRPGVVDEAIDPADTRRRITEALAPTPTPPPR